MKLLTLALLSLIILFTIPLPGVEEPIYSINNSKSGLPFLYLDTCSFEGIALHGRVKYVESFPDIKVQFVSSFPDIKVKFVEAFPDDCGEWQIVESFPDIKVQIVDAFPDIKVKVVDSFPGID